MDTALEPKILKNSKKIESKLALFNMSNSMMSKNTQNEMKKVVRKKVKKDEDKKVSSVKTNREFCMTMVDKLYDVKEQMTDNQYKTLVEKIDKIMGEKRAYKVKVLIPKIDYRTDCDDDDDGYCDLDFDVVEVIEILSKEKAIAMVNRRISGGPYSIMVSR